MTSSRSPSTALRSPSHRSSIAFRSIHVGRVRAKGAPELVGVVAVDEVGDLVVYKRTRRLLRRPGRAASGRGSPRRARRGPSGSGRHAEGQRPSTRCALAAGGTVQAGSACPAGTIPYLSGTPFRGGAAHAAPEDSHPQPRQPARSHHPCAVQREHRGVDPVRVAQLRHQHHAAHPRS